jgi:hypothetical protein
MKIEKPQKIICENEIRFQSAVEFSKGAENLWYSVDKKYGELLTGSSDGLLVALLIPAMLSGEDIQIGGQVSERLYTNAQGPLQKLLKCYWPSLHEINIHPEFLESRRERASGVITGFSCGIDSYCVLDDYFLSQVPGGLKITHLLYNNVGAHGVGNNGELDFQKRFEAVKPVADQLGLPMVKVDSNLDQFYASDCFPKTHTLRNASVALVLQEGIGRFLYGSTYHYLDVFIGPAFDISCTDPITLPLLSTEGVDMVSAGGEYTRVQKTLKVAEIPESHSTLDVCPRYYSEVRNCSTCYKCMRTLLTLDIAGLTDRYAASFDLDAYQQNKARYIGGILYSTDPLLREIIDFAHDRHYAFPFHSHILGYINQVKRFVRKFKNLFPKKFPTQYKNKIIP